MSTPATNVVSNLKYKSSTQELAEPFLADVEELFTALESLTHDDSLYERDEKRPSDGTMKWAKQVLLRVLPRHYLRGAEIEPYYGEIHATWEKESKKVVAFFPEPDQLKVYYEKLKDGNVVCHDLKNTSPAGLSGTLAWFFETKE